MQQKLNGFVWVYVFPVEVRIWRHRDQYLAVVTDPLAIRALAPYTKRRVVVELAGIEITAPLLRLQHRLTYAGISLPKRLNTMWERLWHQGGTYMAQIRIIENESNQATSAPEGQGKTGEPA